MRSIAGAVRLSQEAGVYDADLEDLVQEIMLKLLRAFGWTKGGDEPSTGEAPRQPGFQLEKLRDEQGNWLQVSHLALYRDEERIHCLAEKERRGWPVVCEPGARSRRRIDRGRRLGAGLSHGHRRGGMQRMAPSRCLPTSRRAAQGETTKATSNEKSMAAEAPTGIGRI